MENAIESLISLPISSLSEYWYCKRNMLYRLLAYLPLEEQTYAITDGRIAHAKQDANSQGYDRNGRKEYYNYLVSGVHTPIHGKVDRVFIGASEIEIVEVKRGRIRNNDQHLWQVRMLMLATEEQFPDRNISGSIYYSKSRRKVPVELTEEHRPEIRRVVREILNLKNERSLYRRFKRVDDERCVGCMYQLICGT